MLSRGTKNAVSLIGYLGRDPEIRYTAGGQPVANISVATSEAWTDRQGQTQERTEWHRVVAWGKLAESIGEYLKKGSRVAVEGKLQTRKWKDRDGAERYTTEIVAEGVLFLDRARREEGGYGDQLPSHAGPPRRSDAAEPEPGTWDGPDDDAIPF